MCHWLHSEDLLIKFGRMAIKLTHRPFPASLPRIFLAETAVNSLLFRRVSFAVLSRMAKHEPGSHAGLSTGKSGIASIPCKLARLSKTCDREPQTFSVVESTGLQGGGGESQPYRALATNNEARACKVKALAHCEQ